MADELNQAQASLEASIAQSAKTEEELHAERKRLRNLVSELEAQLEVLASKLELTKAEANANAAKANAQIEKLTNMVEKLKANEEQVCGSYTHEGIFHLCLLPSTQNCDWVWEHWTWHCCYSAVSNWRIPLSEAENIRDVSGLQMQQQTQHLMNFLELLFLLETNLICNGNSVCLPILWPVIQRLFEWYNALNDNLRAVRLKSLNNVRKRRRR